jgi:hypothetical protein
LIKIADEKRKSEDLYNKVLEQGNKEEELKSAELRQINESKFHHLNWLHSTIDLNLKENQDILRELKVDSTHDI